MHCTNTDHSGDQTGECGNEDFDVTVSAMLTADLSGEDTDHTIELDGFSHEDVTLVCKKCGNEMVGTDAAKAATVLMLKLEKRFGATLGAFSSYEFEDGTVIEPEQLQVDELKDVAAGPVYQQAVKDQARYEQWVAAQEARVQSGEINEMDLRVMRTPWLTGIAERHAALLAELRA